MSTSNPELQRLLANLRGSGDGTALSNILGNAGHGEMTDSTNKKPHQTSAIPGLGSVPHEQTIRDSAPPISIETRPLDPRLAKSKPQLHQAANTAVRVPSPSTPVADASNLTTWSSAIKHVQKHILPNEQVTTRIKHLINEQHKHEEQWWKQRQEIVTRHAGRAGNQEKVAGLLQELGGLAAPVVRVDEAADRNELEMFDKKVYKSLGHMAQDFDGQLRKMGVPFFAVKHELVMKDDGKGSEGVLDRGEFRELQRKMLQYLEDLLVD